MPFTWLFGDDQSDADGNVVVRAADRRRLVFNEIGLVDELLTHDSGGTIQLVQMRISPGGKSAPSPIKHEGEVAGVILQGTVELMLSGKRHVLSKDDSFRFDGRLPHHWLNRGDQECIGIVAVTPPFY